MTRDAIVEIVRWVRRAAAVSSIVTAAGFTGQQIAHHLRPGPSSEEDKQLAAALNQSTEASTNSKFQNQAGGNKVASRAGGSLDPRTSKMRLPSSRPGTSGNINDPGTGNPADPGAAGAAAAPNSTVNDAAAAMNNSRAAAGQGGPGVSNPATQAAARQPGSAGTGEPQAGESGAAGGSGSTAAGGDSGSAGTVPYPSATPSTSTTTTTTTPTTPAAPTRTLVANFTPSSTAYSGVTFSVQPSFTANLVSTNKVDQTVSDSVTLGAYADSTCSTAAAGTVAATTNPLAFTYGFATFTGASFTPANHAEESIYLQGSTSSLGLTACAASATQVLQHFNVGFGYIDLGTASPGFAGAPAASRNDVTYAIGDDGNGNYVVGGTSANASGGNELFLARYFPDGTLDTSFATNGVFLFQNNQNGPANSPAATRADQIRGILSDTSGNIVAVGITSDAAGGTDIFLLRLTNSGAADTSLSANGLVVFNAGTAGFAGAPAASKNDQVGLRNPLLIDSADGSYLVAISSANSSGGLEAGLMRITTSGAISQTFGAGNGVATFINHGLAGPGGSPVGARQEYAESVQQDSSGNAIVSYVVSTPTGTDTVVARFVGLSGADGTLDTTFNTNGYNDLHSASGNSAPVDAEVDSKGNIVGVESVGAVLTIFRLLANGTPDLSFGSSGIVTFNPTGPSAAGAAVAGDTPADFIIDANGNYLIAGSSTNATGGTEVAVWRYNSAGALDTTYGPSATGYAAFQRSGTLNFAGQSGSSAIDLPVGNIYFDTLERVTIPVASRNGTGSNNDFGMMRFTSAATADQ